MPHKPSPFDHGRSEFWERSGIEEAVEEAQRLLGVRLRQLRQQRGQSQQKAAEAIGLHPVHISRMESGAANLTVSTLVAIALAYGVPLVALFSDTEGPPQEQAEPKSRRKPPTPNAAVKPTRKRPKKTPTRKKPPAG